MSTSSVVPPIKILYMIDEMAALTAGGTERQILQMAQLMQECGFSIQLCVLRGTEWISQDQINIPVHRAQLRSFKSFAGLRAAGRLIRWLETEQFDIVQTFFVESNLLGPLIARLAGVPVIIGSRRNLNYWMKRRTAVLQSIANVITTRLVANCEAVRQVVSKTEYTNVAKIDVIYNGLDLSQFRPHPSLRKQVRDELGIRESDVVVGNVSALRPIKGTEDFVEAAALVRQKHPSARFILVGDGPLMESLRSRVQELGLTDTFIFTGAQKDVPRFLQAFDIAVLSSESEGFSNSLLEYIAMGLPVVSTDVGGNREALGEAGRFVSPKNPPALADTIINLLEDAGGLQKMRAAATQQAARVSLDRAQERLRRYYQELVDSR